MPTETKTTTTTTESATVAATATVFAAIEHVRSNFAVVQQQVLDHPSVSAAISKTNALLTSAGRELAAIKLKVPASSNVAASATEALTRATALLKEIKLATGQQFATSIDATTTALADAVKALHTWKMYLLAVAQEKVVALDHMFQLSSKTVEYIGLATAQTKNLNDKYSISQRALKLEETYSIQQKAVEAATKVQEFGDNWSGARVSPAVAYLTDLAKQGYATGVERVNLVVDVVTTQAAEQNAASHRAGIQATYTGQHGEKGGLETTASLGYGQAGCRFSDLDRHSSKPLIVQQAASEKTQEIVVA